VNNMEQINTKLIRATLCYIRKDGKTLMLLRNKKVNDEHIGKYSAPGGKLEGLETPLECVIREVKEECGVNIKKIEYKMNLTFPQFDGKNDWVVDVFIANDYDGEFIECNEGKLVWVEDNKILDLNLWDGDRIFLKYLDKKCFVFGKFCYKDKKLISHEITCL